MLLCIIFINIIVYAAALISMGHIRPLTDLSSVTLSISLLKLGITLSIHSGEQKSLI